MRTKNFIGLLLLLFPYYHSFAQTGQSKKQFVLNGTVKSADSVLLYYTDASGKYIHLAKPILNHRIFLKGFINEPVNARILFKNKGEVIPERKFWERMTEIYLEPGQMTLSGSASDLKSLKITGSKSQNELEDLNARIAPVRKEMQPVLEALDKEKDHEKAAEIRDQLEPYNDRIKKITYDFFIGHPNSYVTMDMMRFYISRMKLDSAKRVYNSFNAQMKNKPAARELSKEINKIELGMPGNMAAGFSKTDINDKPLSLGDFKGKYVIVDFWASWCVPCRKGNPHLIRLYNTYNSKGLEIIGISDDDSNHGAWKKAVEQDKIGIWHHVLRGLNMDLRMKNLPNPEDISEKYGISSLPTKILIDPAGKIIGRYGDNNGGSDQDLDKKLEELLK
ncbi:TlpA disulfide reductase family protein [Pedobacter sp.]|jgi:thiol-disulfide isomerase/thioredoxin|uniref:TlpA disulfide reductase family protein n=1 Tax=Pedobacter sp. TaxID=1411316 RepID=UPI002BA8C5F9|nr:TlpA disulfide reductase family protein [Pedobacter sp.]HWW41487.1 TlpA disulfide reductase family protein [Pedobacter sp.]